LTNRRASGGTGGAGGNVGDVIDNSFPSNADAVGGRGGDATATAGTSVASGAGEADATSVGGTGGAGGGSNSFAARGGDGGSASSFAGAGSETGNAAATATATGGSGGSNRFGEGPDSAGGDASASSSAGTGGAGDALSSANATGGAGGTGAAGDSVQPGGNATASAVASATGGGKAIASAVAAAGFPSEFSPFPLPIRTANATSTAETVNGAIAEALSTINPSSTEFAGSGEATAKTSFGGVSVQSSATTKYFDSGTTEAIAQGGSGPTALDPDLLTGAISIALPDKAYAMALIGGANNVAEALLGPGYEIFGIAILEGGDVTATFDFNFRGDLILADVSDDSVSNLGFVGPNVDVTIFENTGLFVIGGAVPEPSTWAMMLLGFAGLGFLVWRGSRKTAAPAA
jgi:PEP-CTERM motif